jgi:L-ascorbate metabolism protein UlaG (beta-lactamase superfamily)
MGGPIVRLADRLRSTVVPPGSVALFYLAQAGFALKTSRGTVAYVDPYFTDCCERHFGFRRMIPPPIAPGELVPDVVASTHSHLDHLDTDALPLLAREQPTRFVGSPDCAEVYAQAGLTPGRATILGEGEATTIADVSLRAVYADHGNLAPDAVGLVLETEGLRVYDVGDSAYRPERILASLGRPVDVMIAPINGAFGNLDADEACRLAQAVQPRLVIASHFWMFVEHGGDPARFLVAAEALAPGIAAMVLAPGETLLVRKAANEELTWTRETLPT